jgi:hypothetical protein
MIYFKRTYQKEWIIVAAVELDGTIIAASFDWLMSLQMHRKDSILTFTSDSINTISYTKFNIDFATRIAFAVVADILPSYLVVEYHISYSLRTFVAVEDIAIVGRNIVVAEPSFVVGKSFHSGT